MMKKVCLIFLFCNVLCLPVVVSGRHANTAYDQYIEQYHELAVRQQQKYGIPASITLAQGILESGAGQGRLAVRANNHFGIKCHDWDGPRIYHDDDKRRECFRRYRRVADSYEDHSLFLKNRSRYASLFELDPTDYKAWAHGLKRAGYATDPTYAYKLITLIDEYELHRYDLAALNVRKGRTPRAGRARQSREAVKTRTQATQTPSADLRLRRAKAALPPVGTVSAYVAHPVRQVHGLRCVEALPGDTYGSIADEFGLSLDKLLACNDLTAAATAPAAGERVYLQPKRRKASRRHATHTVQPGESLYSIAQHYGVRLVSLYDLNGLPYDARATVGQVIRLRPSK